VRQAGEALLARVVVLVSPATILHGHRQVRRLGAPLLSNENTVWWRLKRGWSVEDALTKPPDMNPNRVMVTRGKTEVVTFDTKRGDKI